MPATKRPSTTTMASRTPSTMRVEVMARNKVGERKRPAVCRETRVRREGSRYNAVDCFQSHEQRCPHVRSFRRIALSLALAAALGRGAAQEPLTLPAPLAPKPPAISPGRDALELTAAQRAQDLGLPSIAVTEYRDRLAHAPEAERPEIALALATALLDAGDAAEATRVLATVPEPHGAAWLLRSGLAALQLHQRDVAQSAWDHLRSDEL